MSNLIEYIRKHRFIQLLLLLTVLVVIAFAGYRIHHTHRMRTQQSLYEQIAQESRTNAVVSENTAASENTAVSENVSDPAAPEEEVEEVDVISEFLEIEGYEERYGKYLTDGVVDFTVLQEKNDDIVAYLCLPDSVIDYPVLQGETDGYYLDHNVDGSKGYPGCLYIENVNAPDFDDPATVIYGHHLTTGGMFSDLAEFLDPEYMDNHLFYFVYLPDEIRIYEIVLAAKYSDRHLLADFYTQLGENLYQFNGFAGNEGKIIYDEIEALGLEGNFRSEHAPTDSEQMIYWSTCFPARDRRMIVGARRITADNIGELTGAEVL